ncbi:MAG: type IV toxin-antitoxin system AbiEi family antitoxin domain-containing protein [Actinomycetota bacterium]|nr:type IV toxin-antitoxin system AbiEi family antitoxin domain-containing protein [Actinomycetota bacterium]
MGAGTDRANADVRHSAAYSAADRLAQGQHGLLSLSQTAACGLSEIEVRWLVRRGVIVAVRRGVLRWSGAAPSWRMMAMAAVLAANEAAGDAVLSHRSAGVLWELLPEKGGGRLEVTGIRQCRLAGVTGHRHTLGPDQRTRRLGIPVTTIDRTLLDLAESTSGDDLGRIIDEALRRGLTTTSRLSRVFHEHMGPGRRRISPMKAALRDRGLDYDPADNGGEQRMDRLWDELGLPTSERQYKVRVGRRTYVLDRAIVALKIGIEWNGRERHELRSRFYYDADRRNDLLQAGWLILDFTMRTDPRRLARTVSAAVEQRRRQGLVLPA